MAKLDELKIDVIGTGVVQEAMIDMANTLYKEFGVRLDSIGSHGICLVRLNLAQYLPHVYQRRIKTT